MKKGLLLRDLAVRVEGYEQREAASARRNAELEDKLHRAVLACERAEKRWNDKMQEEGEEAGMRREREKSDQERARREEEGNKREEEVKGKGGEEEEVKGKGGEEEAEGSKGGLLRGVRRRQQKSDLEKGTRWKGKEIARARGTRQLAFSFCLRRCEHGGSTDAMMLWRTYQELPYVNE
ncbi:MAG: hypothetical protein M1840_000821 [Geoglossum simile]|nr:MAG: hypothetical protein M1840_000821 [Geoglossum simile]